MCIGIGISVGWGGLWGVECGVCIFVSSPTAVMVEARLSLVLGFDNNCCQTFIKDVTPVLVEFCFLVCLSLRYFLPNFSILHTDPIKSVPIHNLFCLFVFPAILKSESGSSLFVYAKQIKSLFRLLVTTN